METVTAVNKIVFEFLPFYPSISSITLSILCGVWSACLQYVSVCPHAYLRNHTSIYLFIYLFIYLMIKAKGHTGHLHCSEIYT